jgi:GH18 family chitinase
MDPNFDLYVRNIKEATKGLPIRIHVNLISPVVEKLREDDTWDEQMNKLARQYLAAFKSGKLETSIKNLLETYELDGIFFDWEYPTQSIHKTWFGDFLVSLDGVLGDDYSIGCAISHWCADFPAEAIAVMDLVELMSYDVFDAEGFHATTELAKEHVNTLLRLGYKPEQIDLGIPFYGHPTNGQMSWYGYGSFYDRLDEQGLFHEENTGLKHHFNTPAVVYEKTAWCIEQGIGGVMAFHYSCDAPADSGYSLFCAIQQAKDDAGLK